MSSDPDFDPRYDEALGDGLRSLYPATRMVWYSECDCPSQSDKRRCPNRNRHRAEALGQAVITEIELQRRVPPGPASRHLDEPYEEARAAAHFGRLHLGHSVHSEPHCRLCLDTGCVPPVAYERLEDALIVGKARPCECAPGREVGAWRLPVWPTCARCTGIGDVVEDGRHAGVCPDCGGRGRAPSDASDPQVTPESFGTYPNDLYEPGMDSHPDCDPSICSGKYHDVFDDTLHPEAIWGERYLDVTTRKLLWRFIRRCPNWKRDAVNALP